MVNKSVLVYDSGLFTSFAEVLTKHFAKVYYFAPWENGYAKSQSLQIGSGLDGVERVKYFWDVVNDVDLFIFTDYCFQDIQEELKRQGKLVWGFGKTSWLESDRMALREWQDKENMYYPKTEEVCGLDELKETIKPNQFIKISEFRNDMETLKHYSEECSEQFFDELSVKLGAGKCDMQFIIEDKIDGIEPGYDTWTIAGQNPSKLLCGYEIKDEAYCAKWIDQSQLAKPMKDVQSKLDKVFADESTIGFYSTEIRMPDSKRGYLLDFTARMGNPPFQLYCAMIRNLGEILWNGAQGKVVEPILTAKWGAIAIINSDFASRNWMPLMIENDAKDYVFLMNKCIKDTIPYVVPQQGLSEIGAIVGVGNTLEEAIEMCKKHADLCKGYQLEIDIASLDKAKDIIKEGAKLGVIL